MTIFVSLGEFQVVRICIQYRSVIAVGHKMMGVAYSVISNNKFYRDPGIDYEKAMVGKKCTKMAQSFEKIRFHVGRLKIKLSKKIPEKG